MSDSQKESPAPRCISRRSLLGLLGSGGAAGIAASLASCTASTRAHKGAVDSDALNVRHFGARGDGRSDDTAAISRALRALSPGQTLAFPAGTYPHSAVVAVTTSGVTLQGPGRLLATAEQTSALRIDAPGVTVQHLTVAMGRTTQRWSSDDQHKIFLAPHPNITIHDVHIEGSAAAGLFSYGAQHFRFSKVRVSDTRADGIHMTNGSRYGTVHDSRVSRSGDDGVAVVSYLQDPVPCHDIAIVSPQVHTTTGGRGISVVGGHDVSYHDIEIDHSNAASVYIACEGGDFVTHDTENVTVSGGTVTDANTNSAIDHGAVLVYSGRAGGSVSRVTIADLTIRATRPGASRQIGVIADSGDDLVADIEFRGLNLAATPPPYQGNAPTSAVTLDDVLASGATVRATAS